MSEFTDFYRLLSEVSCADDTNGLYVGDGDEARRRSFGNVSLLSEDEYDALFLPPSQPRNRRRRPFCTDGDGGSISSSSDNESKSDDDTLTANNLTNNNNNNTTTNEQQIIRMDDKKKKNILLWNEMTAQRRMSILEADKEEFRKIKAELSKTGMTTAMGVMQCLDQQMIMTTTTINLAAFRSYD